MRKCGQPRSQPHHSRPALAGGTQTLSPSPRVSSARFLTQLTVVAHVSWLTHAQELSDAVLALTAIQARLGAALVDLCKHLGRGEIRRGR